MPLPSRVTDLGPYELLLSVAQLGSVGAAARAHGVTQPTASARLSGLERRLGIALLDRSARGSRLTSEGALVADWARAAVDAAAALEVGVVSLRRTRDDRLPVAASMTVASSPSSSLRLTPGRGAARESALMNWPPPHWSAENQGPARACPSNGRC